MYDLDNTGGTVDLLCTSVSMFCVNLHQFLVLFTCSLKALLFVKLYFALLINYKHIFNLL